MKLYEININGLPHTVQLSDATARRRGLTPVSGAARPKAKATPANKARTPRNKGRAAKAEAPSADETAENQADENEAKGTDDSEW